MGSSICGKFKIFSIDLRKKVSLDRLIYSLGIRHIGLENAKIISKHLKNIKKFLELSKINKIDELLNIDGIGETQINQLKISLRMKLI